MVENKEVLFHKLPVGAYFHPHDSRGMIKKTFIKLSAGSSMYLKPGERAFIGGMVGNTICTPISIT